MASVLEISNDSERSVSFNDQTGQWLFPRDKLEYIADLFDISHEKVNKLQDDKILQNKCFKKVLRACESENWEKISSAGESIFGIKNSEGKSVYEVLTSHEDAPPNFYKDPPENLIFKGGGPKAIAYVGVLEMLEKRNILPGVLRVGGTSAGAIIATLIALGYTSAEIRTFMTDNLLTSFLDFTSRQGGIFKGDDFLRWINVLIEGKTGIKDCTFGELRRKIKNDRLFKHIHAFAIKVGNNKEIFHFSSEDKRWG